MTVHVCRDFVSDKAQPDSALYLSSVFLFGVLGFTQVGHTNFNLSGSFQSAAGPSASINMGGGNERAVAIPAGTYTVSSADVGKILTLKSSLFPRHNSGLFRVTSVNTSSNWLVVDYRTTSDPPAETNTLDFKLFLSESNFNPTTANNGGTGYRGNGSSTTSRLILQSPHSSSWQVRMTYESPVDTTALQTQATIAPGFAGNSSGDFPTGSYTPATPVEHLHTPLWLNSSNVAGLLRGSAAGLSLGTSTTNATSRVRFYAWGDDLTGTGVFVVRQMSASYADGWFACGMADDAGYELPPRTSQRLFAFGHYVSNAEATISWKTTPLFSSHANTGVAFGLNLKPVSCVLSQLCYVGGQNASLNANGIKAEAVATDNAFLGATELQPVEMFAGTCDSGQLISTNTKANAVYDFDPRCMGLFPFARLGRSNFTTWTLTTDVSSSWFHTVDGMFYPWQGPPVHA